MDNNDYTEDRKDLIESIELEEEEVRIALHELSNAAVHTLDVSDRIRISPLAWTLGAFLVGAWLGDHADSPYSSQRRQGS